MRKPYHTPRVVDSVQLSAALSPQGVWVCLNGNSHNPVIACICVCWLPRSMHWAILPQKIARW